MEHDVEALPIDIRVLADLAQKCRAYAKALHYKELEYERERERIWPTILLLRERKIIWRLATF
jgi:hypothetical protein